jgi:hypothetical protein
MIACTQENAKDERLVMYCECCDGKFDRWDMVEPEDIACEVNKVVRERGETVEFNFCCPHCVTELVLIPLETEREKQFREKNEKLRKVLAPTTIH